jgi:hypothetical protein
VSITFESPTGDPNQFSLSSADGRFATVAAGGRYIVRPSAYGAIGPNGGASLTSGWFVHSVTLDGQDITERPFDLDSDATSLVITFTDRPSSVSGSVKDARGTAVPDAVVLVFPADADRWTGYGRSPRTIRSVAATAAGAYTFDHLPPGRYCVVAIPADDADGWRDPAMLAKLAGRAERVTIAEGDAGRPLDLTLRSLR